MESNLTQEMLKSLYKYDPDTGQFERLVSRHQAHPVGSKVGRTANNGYVAIKIDGRQYLSHRLAFLYMTGSFPPEQVDHINRQPDDNRWCNLRLCTQRQNHENKSTNNKFVGVSWNRKTNRWQVRSPRVNGLQKHIGVFKTNIAACYARHAWEVLNVQ